MNLETELINHLEHLCVDIGPRPIGSEGNRAAADYIRRVFQAAGLEVEEQHFECPAWTHEETLLELSGERMEAAANAFSPPCDISVPAVAVGSVAELAAAELKGRIGVLYGDLTRHSLAAKECTVYNPERDQEIVRLLEEKKPAALITVNLHPHSQTRLLEDWDLSIPSATVSATVGLELLRQSNLTLRLQIDTHSAPDRSANIIARKPGARPERIVLCAHYDTKIETPGAVDNASGVAALLALATELGKRELALGLEFVAFSAEAYSALGDEEYVRHTGDEFGTILAAINMDGIGQRIGTNTLAMMTHSEEFDAEVKQLMEPFPGVVWTDPWPQSNHSTFAWRGVPSIALSSTGAAQIAHEPTDTIEWLSAKKLHEVVSLVTDIVESLQNKSLDWCRKSN